MRARWFPFFLLLMFAMRLDGRTRAVRHSDGLPEPRSVLWIAAHPDDEAIVAPLLFTWCVDDAARCGMVVLTRGESGVCALAEGCSPDLGSVRSAEAGSAAELFHAESFLLRYPDGGGAHAPQWAVAGGPNLEERLAKLIESFDPDVILTFDPRHGSSCHPDHRETGRLVLAAVERIAEDRPAVYLLQTFVEYVSAAVPVRLSAATPHALRFDATQPLRSGAEAWSAVTWDLQRHPSQWTSDFIAGMANLPAEERAVHIAPAQKVLQEPVRSCP